MQSAGVVMMQSDPIAPAAAEMQHAPCAGCGHAVVEHALRFPFHVPPCEAQSACDRIAHTTVFEDYQLVLGSKPVTVTRYQPMERKY